MSQLQRNRGGDGSSPKKAAGLRHSRGSGDEPSPPLSILAFGAHPDDVEFGCGGVIALETRAGRKAHFVICSHGEAASKGTPAQRMAEAKNSAALLGASVEFLKLDGDAHLEVRAAHAIKFARIIRRLRPTLVFVPSTVENQHPDHFRLGQLVRDATRLARFGGLKELRALKSHTVGQLLFYAVSPEAEPANLGRVLVDVSEPEIVATWKSAMEAHASQALTRNYVEFQLTRAHLNGMRAGVSHAIPLFPNDPPLLNSLAPLVRAGRHF